MKKWKSDSIARILTNGLSIGCIEINNDYTIEMFNKWVENHSSLKLSNVIGKNIFEIFPEIIKRKKDKYLINAIENQIPSILSPLIHKYFIHLEIIRDEIILPMVHETRIYPCQKDDGTVCALILIKDLTEQTIYEDELRNAKQEAENANMAKDQFLANMSHELRTPISGIIGMAQMIMYITSNDEIIENLNIINRSAHSLINIIDDILDTSKIESENYRIKNKFFELNEIITQVIKTLSIKANEKGIIINLIINHDVPDKIYSDPFRIEQILRNLINNAIKFTSKGSIVVDISQTYTDNNSAEIVFMVKDTGIGIHKNQMSNLFKKFSQLDISYSKQYQGVGLGLYISKKLVENMGGKIWVESEIGKGSAFYFSLKVNLPVITDKKQNESEIQNQKGSNRCFNILLAEDDKTTSLSTIFFLQKSGHKVTHALNGQEVLSKIQKEKYDIILMDIQMPDLDGVEVTRLIRNSKSNEFDPHIPIIALTALAMKDDKKRFIDAGMNDFFIKPLIIDELNQKMVQHITK